MVRLGDVSPTIWDKIVEQMEEKLVSIGNLCIFCSLVHSILLTEACYKDFQEDDILIDWRILANKKKFDRELFEKYGFLKDIILHPRYHY